MTWFRLGNEALVACRGFGWPLKKAEKNLTGNSNKVVAVDFAPKAEETLAAAA